MSVVRPSAPRVAVFLGTRPEGIKMAPVIRVLRGSAELEPVVINTGQHREMLQQVLSLFEVAIDHDLDVMARNQTLPDLTARLLTASDCVLEQVRPAFALVQGDTTTVLAASLACFYRGIPLGHVEAGLRSGDMRSPFPEEANRVLCTQLASRHYAPTERAKRNLLRDNVAEDRIVVTGNTVIDALHVEVERQRQAGEAPSSLDRDLAPDWREHPFVLVTGHRRENFGEGFRAICAALQELSERFPKTRFVYPVHLNPNVKEPVHAALRGSSNIRLIDPVPYAEFVALLRHCRLVLTDSGGVQEEAPSLGKPVLVMRNNTERPEGLEAGTVRLVGPDRARIVSEVSRLLTEPAAYEQMARAANPYGDGHAAERIAGDLVERLGRVAA